MASTPPPYDASSKDVAWREWVNKNLNRNRDELSGTVKRAAAATQQAGTAFRVADVAQKSAGLADFKATAAQEEATQAAQAANDAAMDASQAIQDAVLAFQAANDAQGVANSKNKVWRQATKPPMTGNTVGDVWFNTAQGDQIARWGGSDWNVVTFGAPALSDGIITAAKLADKAVGSAQLADKAVGSTQLADAVNISISTAQATATNAQTVAGNAATAALTAQTAANNAAGTAAALIASAENKILDPSFSQDQWIDAGGWIVDKTIGRTDSTSLKAPASSTTSQINALSLPRSNSPIIIPVEPGQVWELGGWWRVDDDYNGTPSNSKLRLANQNSGLLGTSTSVPSNPTRNTWTYVSGRYTVPSSGVTGLRLTVTADNTAGNVWWDDLVLRNITAAVKAETDAATAQSAANVAKTVADGAQTAATAAQSAADAAASAASAAQTSANGKNRVIRSTSAATGTSDAQGPFVKGDQWWRYSGSTAVAMWIYDGGWQQQLLGSGAIATGAVTANELATAVNDNISKALADSATAITAAGTAQTTANGKNRLIRSTSAASGTSYTNGDIWYRISGTQVIGMWIYNNGWVQQTLTDSVITNLNAATITAGTISTDRFAANSISVNKLMIGNFTNLIADPSLVRPIAEGWKAPEGSLSSWSVVNTTGLPGLALTITSATGVQRIASMERFQVNPGETYGFGIRAQVQSNSVGTPRVRLVYRTSTGGYVATSSEISISGGWANYSRLHTVPSDATIASAEWEIYIPDGFTGQAWFGNPMWRAATTGNLIVDGAIQAGSAIIGTGAIGSVQIADAAIVNAKIADAQITAAKILSVDAGSITTGFLGADRIAGQSITGTHIAGGTITAANMATGTITASSGILANAAVGTAQIADAAITDVKIQNGTIQTVSIADAAIVDAKIANLNAAKLNAGFISADRFASNSISVSKLLVSNLTNLLEDPGFENTDLNAGWSNISSRATRDTTSSRSGVGALRVVNQSTAFEALRQRVPLKVEPGQKYLFSAWVRGNKTTIDQGLELSVYHSSTDQSPGTAVAVARSPIAGTSYVQFSGVFTVPAGSYFVTPRLVLRTGSSDTGLFYYVDDLAFQKMEDGSLIVDGAITASMLSATAIDGKLITGATIRTAATGQRLQLDASGLTAYDANGNQGARLVSSNGALQLTTGFTIGTGAAGAAAAGLSTSRLDWYPSTGGNGFTSFGNIPNGQNEMRIFAGSPSANGNAAQLALTSGADFNSPVITTPTRIQSSVDIGTTYGALTAGVTDASRVTVKGGSGGIGGQIYAGAFAGTAQLDVNNTQGIANNGKVYAGGDVQTRNRLLGGTGVYDLAMPYPTTIVASGGANNITSTSYTNVGPNASTTITTDRPLWVQVDLQCWAAIAASPNGDLRAGIATSGATVLAVDQIQQVSQDQLTVDVLSAAWGSVIYVAGVANNVGSQQKTTSKLIRLNPGATTFHVQAANSGGSVKQVNYATLTVRPVRWSHSWNNGWVPEPYTPA